MPEFLKLRPLAESVEVFLRSIPVPGEDRIFKIPTEEACRFVNAGSVNAREDSPPFDRSTVDGYAVKAADTFGASESLPVYLKLAGEVPMGITSSVIMHAHEAALIHTGGMLPEGADAVVMLENTRSIRTQEIEIYKAVSSEENTIRRGEDLKSGDLILEEGRRMRPVEIGGLLSQGITKVKVYRQPIVGVISSGDELVPPGEDIKPGQIRDINSHILAALVDQHCANHRFYGITPDDKSILRNLLRQAFTECDAVVVTAGSSVSSRDSTAELIQELGAPGILVHGINIKPGKPTILAVCDGKPVIGLPGNPISAFVIASLVVVPMIEKLSGNSSPGVKPSISAVLSANVPSQSGRLDFIPVSLKPAGGTQMAIPIFFKSNLIFNLVRADGLMRIPEDATGLEAGAQVEIYLI